MIKSMTGYGRNEVVTEERKIIVELKTVNHRYSDISMKLPKKISFFETSIRNLLKQYVSRGKVDVYILYEDYAEDNICVKYNEELAKGYFNYINKISEDFNIQTGLQANILARYPEVLSIEVQEVDEEELWLHLENCIKKAADKLIESRITEGQALKIDLIEKLKKIEQYIKYIEEKSPKIVQEYREKLTNKVSELLNTNKFDESLIITEVTIFADKICADEELVRLSSHVYNMRNTLNEQDHIGRKLDFIAQEMNREANTILSKSSDIEVTNIGIDLKTEIEKIREQIQNIE